MLKSSFNYIKNLSHAYWDVEKPSPLEPNFYHVKLDSGSNICYFNVFVFLLSADIC